MPVVMHREKMDERIARLDTRIVTLKGRPDGKVEPVERIEWIGNGAGRSGSRSLEVQPVIGVVANRFEETKYSMILEWIPDRYRRARVTSQLVGLHCQ